MLRVLIACEFSQIVCKSFRDRGHEAYSCDLLPTEGNPEWHIQDDITKHLNDGWDLMIAHPPCTYLANSGVRWLHFDGKILLSRMEKVWGATDFFNELQNAPIHKICVENPIHHKYARKYIREYAQIIQPYQFGENASKATCLWLKGLPKLKPTKYIEPHYHCRCGGFPFEYALGKYGCPNCNGEYIARLVWGNQTPTGQNNEPPGVNQKANRARTYPGIAQAMASQWG